MQLIQSLKEAMAHSVVCLVAIADESGRIPA
jgi:hypothetical protein